MMRGTGSLSILETTVESHFDILPSFHREVLEALPVAVYTTDAEGRITFYNQAAVDLAGHEPTLGSDQWCVTWKLYWPDGTPLAHDQCPMALALKEGRPNRGMEAIAERPDGTRVAFLPYPTPILDRSGAVIGAVNALVDISSRKQAEDALHMLAAIVESSDDAILSKDLNGIITSWNRGAEKLFGYSAEETIGQPVTMLFPADRQDEEPRILERLRRGETIDHYETVRQRKDGTLMDISLTVSPTRDGRGIITGASKIARDITERKRAEEQRNLLVREMNHRIKNLFAVASSVVTLSARTAQTAADMAQAVRGRLDALMRAQALVLPAVGQTGVAAAPDMQLGALLQTIFDPFIDRLGGSGHNAVSASGPSVLICEQHISSLALVLHELATNAAKYGALSSAKGTVRVTWTLDDDRLQLDWSEQGGPAVVGPPEREGFGSILARRTMEHQLDGRIAHRWMPEGLAISLSVPLAKLRG